MDFYDWVVSKYLGKDTPRGDLAEDVCPDEGFPRNATREQILQHLQYAGACDAALSVFKRTWRDYERNHH